MSKVLTIKSFSSSFIQRFQTHSSDAGIHITMLVVGRKNLGCVS